MERKWKPDKSKIIRLLVLLAVNGAFMAFCLLFCHTHYEINDDFAMMGIVSGLYGKCDPHMVYSNILIGRVLVLLYTACHSVNWYVIFHMSTLFVSSMAFSYTLLDKKRGDKRAYVCVALFYVFLLYECYVNVTFTKTAGFASICGLAVILLNTSARKLSWFQIVLGGLLAFTGSMIRFYSFLIALFAAGVFFLLYILLTKPGLKRIAVIGSVVLAVLGIGYAARIYDAVTYKNDPEWNAFREYNEVRGVFTDRPLADYDQNEEFYHSLGISANDYYLFSHWTFDDPEFVTTELMKEVNSIKKNADAKTVLSSFCKQIVPGILQYRFSIAVLVLAVLVGYWEKKALLALIPAGVVVGFFNLYFAIVQRFLMRRVDLVVAVSVFVMLSLFIFPKKEEKATIKKSFFVYLALGALALNIGTMAQNVTSTARDMTPERKNYLAMYERFFADQDHLYLSQTYGDMTVSIYHFTDEYPMGFYENTYLLGGWMTRSPISNMSLKKYGISNPFRDMVDNPKVYVLANSAYRARIVTYLKEHYGDVKSEVVDTIEGLQLFRVVSK